jgi:hypothetical protein
MSRFADIFTISQTPMPSRSSTATSLFERYCGRAQKHSKLAMTQDERRMMRKTMLKLRR